MVIGAWAYRATTQVADALNCDVNVPVIVAGHVGESDPGVTDDIVASCTEDTGVEPEYT